MSPSARRLLPTCRCCVNSLHSTGISRRRFLAAGAAALALGSGAGTGLAQAAARRIDVHHHIVPPVWLAAMDVIGRSDFPLKSWSIQKTIEDMDKGGVAT